MSEASPKLQGIQYLRFLAAFGVLLFHAGGIFSLEKYQANTTFSALTDGLDTGVDLFFVISGFVIALSLFQERRTSIGRFLRARIFRIYPMSILVSLIFIGSSVFVLGNSVGMGTLFSSLTLLPAPKDPVPIVLWTLKQELLFYAVFSLTFLHRSLGLLLVAAWSTASFTFGGNGPEGHWFTGWLLLPNNVQFLFGVLACWLYCTAPREQRFGIALFACSGVLFLALSLAIPYLDLPNRMEVLLLALIGGGLIFGAACSALPHSRLFMMLGAASYSIYLIHFFFLSLFNKVIVRLSLPDPAGFAILVVTTLLASVAFYLATERPLENWRKTHQHRTLLRANRAHM